MTELMNMIGAIRTLGVSGDIDPITGPTFRHLDNEEWARIEECRPFVFHETELVDDSRGFIDEFEGYEHRDDIDAPFKVFSIEAYGGPIAVLYADEDLEKKVPMEYRCIIVIEREPKSYEYFVYGVTKKQQFVIHTNTVGELVAKFLANIKQGQLGDEAVRGSVQIGNGKSKRTHRIRRIIHVAPRGAIENIRRTHSAVDWSHRFEVRGHWRKTDALGKDRDGNYCVRGYTWVVDHTKGPENLPLIKKTRLVKHHQEVKV